MTGNRVRRKKAVRSHFVSARERASRMHVEAALERRTRELQQLRRRMNVLQAKAGVQEDGGRLDEVVASKVGTLRRLELELNEAIEKKQFFLLYQPILSAGDAKIRGFEALLRWRHPQHGTLSPEDFLPMLEKRGLICAVGRWVLKNACRQIRIWQNKFPAEPPLTMSVNVSVQQLRQPGFVEMLREVLDATGLAVGSLTLEITESIAMIDTEWAREVLQNIKKTGAELSMDDFGTGFSSLGYLRWLPFDSIKIDRSFVSGLDSDLKDQRVLRLIVSLAHEFDMKVVAEGAETPEETRCLKLLGCDYVQGYYFFRPLEPVAVLKALVKQKAPVSWAASLGGGAEPVVAGEGLS